MPRGTEWLVSIVAAAVLQVLGAVLLADRAPAATAVLVGLGLIVGGAGLATWSFGHLARVEGDTPQEARLLSAAVSLFLPVAGPLVLLHLMRTRWRHEAQRTLRAVRTTELPGLPVRPLEVPEPRFGPGALEGILRHARDPEERLRVLSACRQLPGQLAVRLLRLALRDANDAVRLLAHAMLDSRERAIFEQINGLTTRLIDGRGPSGVHGRLASHYWELAYQGLAEGEMRTFVCNEALKHADIALARRPDDVRLLLLVARVHLLHRRATQAMAALDRARARGLPADVIGPYVAEAAFLQRRPRDVRRHLAAAAASVRRRGALVSICEQWT